MSYLSIIISQRINKIMNVYFIYYEIYTSFYQILENLPKNLNVTFNLDCLIRSELMEQVPHIAIYCQEVPEHLGHAVPHHLLPLVVKFLVDSNHQVRKTSQAALLVLLEQGLVEKSDVEQQVHFKI